MSKELKDKLALATSVDISSKLTTPAELASETVDVKMESESEHTEADATFCGATIPR